MVYSSHEYLGKISLCSDLLQSQQQGRAAPSHLDEQLEITASRDGMVWGPRSSTAHMVITRSGPVLPGVLPHPSWHVGKGGIREQRLDKNFYLCW